MSSRSAVTFDLSAADGWAAFLRRVDELPRDSRTTYNFIARELSQAAAARLQPLFARAIRSSPAPQAAAVAATVRAKRDRMIVVTAGTVNPGLSGWRRSPRGKSWRGSVAWGVALGGPGRTGQQVKGGKVKGHRRAGARVTTHQRAGHGRRQGNVYRVARRGGPPDPFAGYLSGHRDRLVDAAADAYGEILVDSARARGWLTE